jgi:hypothetical protein
VLKSFASLRNCIEDIYLVEDSGWATVAYSSDLTRLRFTAIERATEYIGRWTAYSFHCAPEICGCCLIGNIFELSDYLSILNTVELLTSELEVVSLHIN